MKRIYMTPAMGLVMLEETDVIATSGISVWNGSAPKIGEDQDVVDFN